MDDLARRANVPGFSRQARPKPLARGGEGRGRARSPLNSTLTRPVLTRSRGSTCSGNAFGNSKVVTSLRACSSRWEPRLMSMWPRCSSCRQTKRG